MLKKKIADHFFGRTGILSVEACRLALAVVYLIINVRHDLRSAAHIRSSYPAENYEPDGILMLFGPVMPSDSTIDLLILLSRIFPWLLLFGVFSRMALWGTLFSHLFLRTLIESFHAGWSHGFNVVFLAHIAFLFAPVGQRWSVDALVRQWRRKPLPRMRDGFWAVVMGQWAVALMFASAFYWKALYNVRAPFSWAHWENMRNQLLYRYEWCGDPVPAYLEPVIQSPFLCGALAWGNLIFQIMPLFSLFFLHRPVLRLVLGLGFVVEELGLALVMGLADLHWLPLIAFFVDWDHFLRRAPKASPAMPTHARWKVGLAMAFIGTYLMLSLNVTGPAFGYNVYDLRAYPFSQFSMYSGYFRSHVPGVYAYAGTTFNVEEGDLTPDERQRIERVLKRRYYGAYSATLQEARGVLAQALAWANDPERTGVTGKAVEQLAMYRTLHVFRTDTAHLAHGPSGLIGRVRDTGACLTSARFTRSIPDTASVALQDECAPLGITHVLGADIAGVLRPLPFHLHGTECRLPLAALEGQRYLYVERNGLSDPRKDALLFEVVFAD